MTTIDILRAVILGEIAVAGAVALLAFTVLTVWRTVGAIQALRRDPLQGLAALLGEMFK